MTKIHHINNVTIKTIKNCLIINKELNFNIKKYKKYQQQNKLKKKLKTNNYKNLTEQIIFNYYL